MNSYREFMLKVPDYDDIHLDLCNLSETGKGPSRQRQPKPRKASESRFDWSHAMFRHLRERHSRNCLKLLQKMLYLDKIDQKQQQNFENYHKLYVEVMMKEMPENERKYVKNLRNLKKMNFL